MVPAVVVGFVTLEPVDVVVAKARVRGEPEIEVVAPSEVRVKPRQRVRVKYLYKLDETSRAREEWGFQLHSNVGDQRTEPIASVTKDRFMLHDEIWGVLVQEFRFEKPGRYKGDFRVRASYAKRNWSRTGPRDEVEENANGIFKVLVQGARRAQTRTH
ncbi:MAG: hypothetical protein HYT80_03675, partial [Euryarchaeota archaeon]|nr:hypothetical protein [Euryarchaeota archaeon]